MKRQHKPAAPQRGLTFTRGERLLFGAALRYEADRARFDAACPARICRKAGRCSFNEPGRDIPCFARLSEAQIAAAAGHAWFVAMVTGDLDAFAARYFGDAE